MTYEQARAFIEQTTKFGSILGLTSMKALMEELKNVQDTIPIVHIAGTNGKGSVGAYLASIFREAGYHVGRYCSPAVFHPLECWQYDERRITETEYAAVMSQVKEACDIVVCKGIQPTVFEIETAAAFVYFSQLPTDILLLETGLGGATDATNIIKHPLACVFTTISRDHMQFLGETLTEIAAVKSGILKPRAEVFSAPQKLEVQMILEDSFMQKNSDIQSRPDIQFVEEKSIQIVSQKVGELVFSYKKNRYTTQLSGSYQIKNAALAIETAEKLLDDLEKGKKRIKNSQMSPKKKIKIIAEGIRKTVWPGRFEVLQTNPLFIIDGAHNEDAAYMLVQTCENCFTKDALIYIIGVLADKEHKQMLQTMQGYSNKVYTITPHNPRALSAEELAAEAGIFYKEVVVCETIEQAVTNALEDARKEKKAVLAFGSLSYLAQLKQIVLEKKQ